MKKNGIIMCTLCAVAIVSGALWFMDETQNKTEQEKTVLRQKINELEKNLSAAQDKIKKEIFVNPLFYKKLEATGSYGRDTYLTPNSLLYSNSTAADRDTTYKTGWSREDCELLENEQDYIIMYCRFYYYPPSKGGISLRYRFTIKECDPKDYFLDCQYKVIQNSALPTEKFSEVDGDVYVIR